MVDYSLQQRWYIACALNALRRLAEDPYSSEIIRLRAAAAILARMDFKATSHD